MEITGIISAIVIGLIIGVLGRLVVPGRQHIGVLWTILIGIVAALVGAAIASALGVAETRGSTGSNGSSRSPSPRWVCRCWTGRRQGTAEPGGPTRAAAGLRASSGLP